MAATTEARRDGSLFQTVRAVLVRPRAMFGASTAPRLRGWWLMALLTLITLGVTALAYAYANGYEIYRIELDGYAQLPADEQVRMPLPELRMSPPITIIMRTAGKILGTLAAWGAWSGSIALMTTVMGRKPARLGELLNIIVWAWTPYLVRGLVQSGFMVLTKQPIHNQGLSGFFLDRTPPPMLIGPGGPPIHYPTQTDLAVAAFLSRVDVYTLWHLALLRLGVAGTIGISRRKAGLMVAVMALVLAGLATLPTLFGQALGRFRIF